MQLNNQNDIASLYFINQHEQKNIKAKQAENEDFSEE